MSSVRKYVLYFTSSNVSSWHVSSLTKPLSYKAASAAWRYNIPHCSSLLSPSLEPWLTWTFPEIATLGPHSNAPLSLKWQPVVRVYNPAVISTKITNQITVIHCPWSPSLKAHGVSDALQLWELIQRIRQTFTEWRISLLNFKIKHRQTRIGLAWA